MIDSVTVKCLFEQSSLVRHYLGQPIGQTGAVSALQAVAVIFADLPSLMMGLGFAFAS